MGMYDDIINLPHHVSKKHPQMSKEARSAQFAPFAALTGYDDLVKETARITCNKKELAEEEKVILDAKLKIIQQKINTMPKVGFTYFVQDAKKNGGSYVTIVGNVKRIDRYKRVIVLQDNTEIPMGDIVDIEVEI